MSGPAETNKNSTESAPESPTTARPLDLDDDDVQENSMLADDGPAANTPTAAQGVAATEAAPPKPPRPLTETQKNELILKEAFPGVEELVIKAVLSASGGRVEPAFNALLEMTDPEAVKREPAETPPPQPPRPQGRREMSQMEADELYARQLAQQYDNAGAYEARTSNRQRDRSANNMSDEDREYNFIDDELPVIRDNLRKGFAETQTKVNGWISTLRKRLEDTFDESNEGGEGHGQYQRRPGEPSRRSGDYDRYDADPQVLGDDFANIRLNADGSAARQGGAHAGVFRPPPQSTSPRPSDGRRVGFKEETEEINMYETSPKVPPKDPAPGSGAKASKWQPLSTMEPSPITDNDPFSLGDSEDEKEAKEKPKDPKQDENERLKQAAAEAMADSLVGSNKEESGKKA
ncbi:hypothetical protein B0I35DRAFT_407929 [Stachybotrys elegans]|uniref:CUE domain-containing protein n=1 Tax=Stachybotrys elegans TaxID=80388 RepID=A0A8K0WSJ7_9HYPO|nr:hypothetical protein B0I35DRAFT_407929 [Stachybotrys elegans]